MKVDLLLLLGLLTCIPLSALSETAPGVSMHRLTGPIYLVEDNDYDNTTNSLIYIGRTHVTVIGASWTPDTARAIAGKTERITSLPVREVIDTSPDPEWSGGNGYWKSIGAKVPAIQVTSDLLERTWTATVEACRENHPTYPQNIFGTAHR